MPLRLGSMHDIGLSGKVLLLMQRTVLPYVYQGAVEHYHWLTAHQMIDGLALGETTPGPLIMVVTYVGFVSGWTKALFGTDQLFLAGVVAACIVTYFTFLPIFMFILTGGPLVESTQGNLKFTAPLTGITAALIGLCALSALLRYKFGVIPVIAICCAVGWLFIHFKPWFDQAGVSL